MEQPPSATRMPVTGLAIRKFARAIVRASKAEGDSARAIAISLRDQIEAAGGFWIVIAKFLASRRDLFAVECCEELSRTVDRVAPMTLDQVGEVFREDFNRPITSMFEEVSETPVWTSSAGQLHEAILRRTGEPVWLQVQRPEAATSLREDIDSIEKLCRVLSTGPLRRVPWMRVFRSGRSQLSDSLDYRYLAFIYRDRHRRWKKLSGARSPKVYRKICTQRVLVMERFPGITLARVIETLHEDPDRVQAWLEANEVHPRKLTRRLYELFLSEIIEHSACPPDFVPERILVLRRGRFGVMPVPFAPELRLEIDRSRAFRGLSRHLPRRSYANAYNDVMALMEPLPPFDPLGLKKQITRELRAWGQRDAVPTLPPEQRSIGSLFFAVASVCRRRQIVLESSAARALDTWQRIELVLLRIDPKLTNMRLLADFFSKSAVRMARAARKRRARARQPAASARARAQVPFDLMDAMERFAELISEKALQFSNRASKPAYLFQQVFAGLRNFVVLLGCATLVAFVHKFIHPVPLFDHGSSFGHYLKEVLDFSWLDFISAGVTEVWLFVLTHRIALRFSVADSALPGHRSI